MFTAPATAAEVPKADLYVAPGGHDGNPGTAEAPLASPAKARDLLRQRIAGGLKTDLCVLFRGGTYRLDQPLVFGPEDSGTEAHSVTYAAWPGEKVIFSGGRWITGWKRSQGKIWTVELPEAKARRWYFRQLFVNGKPAVRARFPNLSEKESWWRIRTSDAKRGAPDADQATYTLSVDRPIQAWGNPADIEFVWIFNNDGSRKRLGSINESAQTFTLPPPHQWPMRRLPGEYQIGYPEPKHFCYFENALEFLDEPGEWYLDRKTGLLSYWPREGEDMERAEVVAPAVHKTLLAVTGQAERPVRNLHFRGIHVAHVDWPLPPHGFTAMFGCLQLASGETPKPWAKFHWIDAAVSFQHARNCNFTDGGVEHVGGIGLALLAGTSGNVVEGNHIHHLGGGGIVAGGIRNRDTLAWAPKPGQDDHKGYRIANNHIHDCGGDYFGAIGIFVALAQQAAVAHNLVHDIAYTGIVLSGNEDKDLPFARDNVVEFNHIHHVQKLAVDGAGIYVSFPQAGSGAIIRRNWIHDISSSRFNSRSWTSPGIYLDGVREHWGVKNYHFQGNVVQDCGRPVFIHQCKKEDNTWEDNEFAPGSPAKEVVEAISEQAGLEKAYRQRLGARP